MDADPVTDFKEKDEKVGLCKKIIGSIWNIPNDEANLHEDQELFVKKTFRELLTYVVFLVFVCIIAFGMTSTNMYYFNKVMMDLFLDKQNEGQTFKDIHTIEDFWKYCTRQLMDGLYWTKWYNGDPLEEQHLGYIYYENKLLGVPRLRQLRVKKGSCEVNEEFRGYIQNCYAVYTPANEDKEAFGPYRTSTSGAWRYQPAAKLKGTSYWGKNNYYPGGGYVQDLNTTRDTSHELITHLQNNLWVNHGSRVVFISFTVYNANINLFCVITLVVEFPATGGATPTYSFYTVKLLRYVDSLDQFIYVCEILFAIFVFYYFVEELIEVMYVGLSYFMDVWNTLDVCLIVVAIVYFVFNIIRSKMVTDKLDELVDNRNSYVDFEEVGYYETHFNNTIAFMVFLAWVKVFKYISFNKTMTQLSTTLSRCAKDLLGFFIMFFIVFAAFTQLGYLLFGTQVEDFSTFMRSFFTLFRIILGDFDFHQLEKANRILGPIFFILFVFFVFFVLINMFLAIINDTYSEVKSDMAKQTDLFIMSDYLKQTYMRLWEKCTPSKAKLDDVEKAVSKGLTNKKITFNDWVDELEKQGYNKEELDMVWAKYDIDGTRVMDKDEQKKLLEELHKQKALTEQSEVKKTEVDVEEEEDQAVTSTEFVPIDEFMALHRRVDKMEAMMSSVITNIDSCLSQLADIKRKI